VAGMLRRSPTFGSSTGRLLLSSMLVIENETGTGIGR